MDNLCALRAMKKAYEMYKLGNEFHSGDGIVTKGVENTIANVSALAKEGMKQTDVEIIKIMTSDKGEL